MSQPIPESLSHEVPVQPLETVTHHGPYSTNADAAAPLVVPDGEVQLSLPGYEFLGVLGRGGMGIVYKARQVALNRLVAIKMILTGAHASEQEIHRFRSEAETIARLRHPHIVQIHEVGEIGGRLFCVLEFAEGGTLTQQLAGTPLPPREAACLVEKLADALQAAHDANIIHRDLKPQNVLLASRGRESLAEEVAGDFRPRLAVPKITDFGLAKRLDDESGQTQSGAIMGTPSYMAPEQASGLTHAIGPAADIYALGAILYECLTGRPPFRAANMLDTLEQVRSQEPVSPSRLQPTVPRDLEIICLKCLAKEPARRYLTARELAADLGRYLRGEPIHARPVSTWERAWKWARRRPLLAGLAGTLTAAALGLIVLTVVLLAANKELTRQTNIADEKSVVAVEKSNLAAEKVIRLNVGTGARHLYAGDFLESIPWFTAAFREEQKRGAAEGSPELEMHRLRLGMVLRQCARPVQVWTDEEAFLGAMFSAAGDRVMGYTTARAMVWDVRTGERVAAIPSPTTLLRASLSPDGKQIALLDWSQVLRIVETATGKVRFALRTEANERQFAALAFSPNSNKLLLAFGKTVQLLDVPTGQLGPSAIEEITDLQQARFSPDGSRIVTVAQDTVGIWGTAAARKLWTLNIPKVAHAEISTGGNYLVARTLSTATIRRIDSGAAVSKMLGTGYASPLSQVVLSPDEERVAIATTSRGTSELRFWERSLARPMFRPFLLKDDIGLLRYTPDGGALAIVTDSREVHLRRGFDFKPIVPPIRDDVSDIRVGEATQMDFSSDGRLLLLRGGSTIRLWDLAAGDSRSVGVKSDGIVQNVHFSRDGSKLVTLTSRINDSLAVEIVDAMTGTKLASAAAGKGKLPEIAVSPDGARVVVWRQIDDERRGLTLLDFSGPKPSALTIFQNREIFAAFFSQDSRRLLTVLEDDKHHRAAEVSDAATGKCLSPRITFATGYPVLSPDGKRVATTTNPDGHFRVHILDSATGKDTTKPMPLSGEAQWLIFSDDGTLLATSTSSEARVWNADDGSPLTDPLPHAPSISRLCLSPDNKVLATISGVHDLRLRGAEIRLWDVGTGNPLCTPIPIRDHRVNSLQFRRDSRLLLVGSDEGACLLLDPARGEPVSPMLGARDEDFSSGAVVFSPDENEVRAFSRSDSLLRGWDVAPLRCDAGTLDLISSVLGRQRPGPDGKITAVTPQQQVRDWKTLRADPPSGWLVSRNEELAWRTQTATQSMTHQQYTVALRHLDAYLEQVPDDKRERLRRVTCYRQLSRWNEALVDLGKLLVRHDRDADVWRQRGQVHEAMGQWQKADADYGTAIQRDGTRGELWHDRGWLRAGQQNWAGAAADFGLAIDFGVIRAWESHRVMALLGARDEKAARAACLNIWNQQKAGKWTAASSEAVSLAILFPGMAPNPQEVLQEALSNWRVNPQSIESNLFYGAALMRAGQYDKAAERLASVLKTPAGEWYARAGFFMSITLARQGKQPEARTAFDEAVRQHDRFLKEPAAKDVPPVDWTWRQYVGQLRAEAESLLKGK
jgi:WD40 repeat protein/tetratricopeptide (TPR) repeat protein